MNNEWEKELDDKFADITHFGCPSTVDIPCGTLRHDLKTYIRTLLAEERRKVVEEIEKTQKELELLSYTSAGNTEDPKGSRAALAAFACLNDLKAVLSNSHKGHE